MNYRLIIKIHWEEGSCSDDKEKIIQINFRSKNDEIAKKKAKALLEKNKKNFSLESHIRASLQKIETIWRK